ncbi:Cif family virulence factor [Aquimarina megaterium]|uniref:hypothetical protein n=1 Tax=Aquimarina megaterium TaxID=1443666 RepID=UPI0004701FEC|nr:hypothetical protein [Aquimarina megaterium]
MSKFKIIAIVLITFLCFTRIAIAQEDAVHKKINADMYGNFSKAFETLDYDLFASIHSKEMIRISGNGGEIKKANAYLKGYEKRWSVPSKKPALIDFRLFERIYSDSLVSDRGIYRVTYIDDSNQTKHSYGQFHVILKIEDKSWKIWVDYDSDENKSINKDSYDAAFSISEYKKYWKH